MALRSHDQFKASDWSTLLPAPGNLLKLLKLPPFNHLVGDMEGPNGSQMVPMFSPNQEVSEMVTFMVVKLHLKIR